MKSNLLAKVRTLKAIREAPYHDPQWNPKSDALKLLKNLTGSLVSSDFQASSFDRQYK